MTQSLYVNRHLNYPHRNTPVELHKHYDPNLVPTFETKEFEARWERLSKSPEWMKPVVSSIAYHHETLSALNINALVYDLFNKASLKADIIFGLPSYKELVYEFLSSLVVKEGDGFYGEYEGWEFRIQNRNFYMSRREAAERLGFPELGLCHLATNTQRLETWKGLTRLDELGLNPSPYSIISDAWRYVHRLIATGINCHPETSDIVAMDDLDILWAIGEAEPINWFDVFSARFKKMQATYGNLPFVGCTSLITLIAEVCNFRFYCVPSEHRELDFGIMKKLKILARKAEVYNSEEEDPSEDEPYMDKEKEKASTSKSKEKKQKAHHYGSDWEEFRKFEVREFRKRPTQEPIEIDSD